MSRFAAPIAEQIWDMKYRFKEADGTPIDGSVEDSWRRIARALAEVTAGLCLAGEISIMAAIASGVFTSAHHKLARTRG